MDHPSLMLSAVGGTARGARRRRRDAVCAVDGWPRGGLISGPGCPTGGRSSGQKVGGRAEWRGTCGWSAASFGAGGEDGRAGC